MRSLNLLIFILAIKLVSINIASSEVVKNKITLQLKEQVLTASEVESFKTIKALDSSGKNIKIFASHIVLPNGKIISITAPKYSRIYTANDRVMIARNSADYKYSRVLINIYDLNGLLISKKSMAFGSGITVADAGFMAVSDSYEGYGEHIYVFDKNGKDVNAIKPYKGGFDLFSLHATNNYFIAALTPVDKANENSKVLIINQEDGQILKEITIDLHGPKSIQSNKDSFAIHDVYVSKGDNVFHSNFYVLNVFGEVINTLSENAQLYLLSTDSFSIIICNNNTIKSVNYENDTIFWQRKYSELYRKPLISKPADIPTGFNLYPLQLLQLSTANLLAINLGQSSFNSMHAKYEAELTLLDKNTGEIITQQYLGKRNINLNLLTTPDGIDVGSNRGYFSYQIISN